MLFPDSVLAINALNGTESHFFTKKSWSWIALLHSNGLIGAYNWRIALRQLVAIAEN
jgi:hypothetical protein